MSKEFNDLFKDAKVMYSYGLGQAIEDGALTPVFANRWKELSGGKPIVATAAIKEAYSMAALREMWNEFVQWRTHVMPTLPEQDRLFVTQMNSRDVWIMEDGAAFTIMFPEDY